MIKTLTKGNVVLNSGIHGKITEVDASTIVLDVFEDLDYCDKSAIARMHTETDAQVAKK